jgi:hypothetical protein
LRFATITCCLLSGGLLARAADSTENDPKDADFKVQGEYTGEGITYDGKKPVGVQVIALGGGKFHSVGYVGGLPGSGWDKSEKKEADGEMKDGVPTFKGDEYQATIKDGVMTIVGSSGDKLAELKKTERKSPTLGAAAPAGAVVLFDGKSADKFDGGRLTEDGLLMQGANSKQKFGACTLHLEFRLPFMPDARGQGRANSGVYLQSRYEVQVLDSFGLKGENNECGGIYTIKVPDVNMCYPPLAWQTYDIDYAPAVFEGGKKTKHATISVKHNGVLIHDKVELDHATTAAPLGEGPEPGPLHLQDHGNPVRYRNIWVVEKK